MVQLPLLVLVALLQAVPLCFLMFCYQPLLWYHFLTACTLCWLSCQEGAVVCTQCAENSTHLGAHMCRSYPTVYTACMQRNAKCSVNGHADTTALPMQGSSYSVGPCDHLHRLAWLQQAEVQAPAGLVQPRCICNSSKFFMSDIYCICLMPCIQLVVRHAAEHVGLVPISQAGTGFSSA